MEENSFSILTSSTSRDWIQKPKCWTIQRPEGGNTLVYPPRPFLPLCLPGQRASLYLVNDVWTLLDVIIPTRPHLRSEPGAAGMFLEGISSSLCRMWCQLLAAQLTVVAELVPGSPGGSSGEAEKELEYVSVDMVHLHDLRFFGPGFKK